MWTLIISVMVWGGSTRAMSIDHIDGFQTRQACDTAAAVFNQHEGEAWRDYTVLVCVPKG